MISRENLEQMAKGLELLSITQEKTSVLVPGAHAQFGVDKEQVALYMLCLIDELGELSKELGYKPWKPIDIDVKKVADELADVLAFFGIILYYIQEMTWLTGEDIAEAYRQKTIRNIERFIGQSEADPDYRGVSNDVDYAKKLLKEARSE